MSDLVPLTTGNNPAPHTFLLVDLATRFHIETEVKSIDEALTN